MVVSSKKMNKIYIYQREMEKPKDTSRGFMTSSKAFIFKQVISLPIVGIYALILIIDYIKNF